MQSPGGAGFIGSRLAETLLRDGQRVRVIDNLLTGRRENLAHLKALDGDLDIRIGDINDQALLRDIMRGADFALHQAALPSVPRSLDKPLDTHLHCVTGTLNVLLAARHSGVKRVVYAASGAAYGDQPGDSKVETMLPAPISPYGVAKLAGEYYAAAFTRSYGLETVSLRYSNVFGPRQDPASQYAAVIPTFITAMLRGQRPTINGDGGHSRDFTYVDNVVQGNLLACSSAAGVGAGHQPGDGRTRDHRRAGGYAERNPGHRNRAHPRTRAPRRHPPLPRGYQQGARAAGLYAANLVPRGLAAHDRVVSRTGGVEPPRSPHRHGGGEATPARSREGERGGFCPAALTRL